ncbi:MAG: DUF1659 domain-containing protein [Tissierella sp.]|uniref:DUF1659 domain-containing protein n=1 Tax=Tissierella sp. TaxID=41274 RepID=UPI003F9B22BB
MAIKSIKEKTNLKLQLDGGIVDEKQRIISKSFTKVKPEALDEELYQTAKVLESLQNNGLLNVLRVEETSIKEEV